MRSRVCSYFKNAVSVIIIVILIFGGIHGLENVTTRTDSRFKYEPFFTEKTDYDVLFFGTSHVLNGIFPMQLWKDYGITSYNFGGHANTIAASYWVARLATGYHKPKIAVLDVFGAEQEKTAMKESYAHLSFDTFPLSMKKIEAIRDIYAGDKSLQEEMLLPLSLYHGRWENLTSDNWANFFYYTGEFTREKGAESRINVESNPKTMTTISRDQSLDGHTVGIEYIKKFIDYCRASDIEPVLVCIPYVASEKGQKAANAVGKIAKEEKVLFLNMLNENAVDFDIDLYDSYSHLNPSGARKVTAYIGKFLSDTYGLTSHKNDKNYTDIWSKDYYHYKRFLENNLKNQTELKETLMLLNNKNFYAVMHTTSEFYPNEVEQKLIDQLGNSLKIKSDLVKEKNKNSENDAADIKIDVYDKTKKKILFTKSIKEASTLYGSALRNTD